MDFCKAIAARMFTSELCKIINFQATQIFNMSADLHNLQYDPYNGILFSDLKNNVEIYIEYEEVTNPLNEMHKLLNSI